MQKQSSSESGPSLLNPTVPADLGARSQRLRIIAAMISCCADKTYAATTIGDIVSGASISRTTFYKRFADKRACFDAAVEHCLEEIHETVLATIREDDPPAEAVRRASAATLALLAARPALASLLTADAVAVDPAIAARHRALVLPVLASLWDDRQPPQRGISPSLAFARAQLLVCGQLAAGQGERLPELQKEIVYLALAPFIGHEEAVREARRSKGAAEGPDAVPSLDR